jgi:serine/threonine protein kinase
MIGEAIAHYRIINKLGAGGMGEVYLAQDTQLGRRVTIKLLPPQTISDEHARKRLVRAARAARRSSARVQTATIKSEWQTAKAWLYHQLSKK